MPWLPVSQNINSHDNDRVNKSFSSIKKDLNYMCHPSFDEWQEMQIYFYGSENKFSMNWVKKSWVMD